MGAESRGSGWEVYSPVHTVERVLQNQAARTQAAAVAELRNTPLQRNCDEPETTNWHLPWILPLFHVNPGFWDYTHTHLA